MKQSRLQAEILFETFNVPALYLARSPVLGAFSLGVSTGVVVDIGASCTRVTPVYDGYVLNSAWQAWRHAARGDDKPLCSPILALPALQRACTSQR